MADGANPPVTMLDLVQSLREPGFRLIDPEQLYELLYRMLSTSSSVVATGTSRATAKQLTASINSVLSASASQNALILPPGLVGQQVLIANNSSVALNIFPFGVGDYILPAGSSTPTPNVAQAANTTGAYTVLIINTNLTPPITYWKQTAAL